MIVLVSYTCTNYELQDCIAFCLGRAKTIIIADEDDFGSLEHLLCLFWGQMCKLLLEINMMMEILSSYFHSTIHQQTLQLHVQNSCSITTVRCMS